MNEIITKEAIQELQKALTPVVEKLGKGGEWVYGVYYKQQIVIGITSLIQAFLGLIVIVAVAVFLYKVRNWVVREFEYSPKPLILVVLIFPLLFAIPAFYDGLLTGLSHLINPDYYILQDLLSIIKRS